MKSNFYQETSVALILVVLLLLIVNPFKLWMPSMMLVSALGLLVVIFAIFASFILRENVQDEREGVHRMLAGRMAFLSGSIVLIIGIVIESMTRTPDMWLVLALVVMILAKIGTRIYSDRNL